MRNSLVHGAALHILTCALTRKPYRFALRLKLQNIELCILVTCTACVGHSMLYREWEYEEP